MDPRLPRLSVVIPTHDTRALTLRCLETLPADAGGGPLEVVVVDDGSRDGTAEAIAERFPAVRVLAVQEAEGFTRAANRGLAAASAPLLLLLNSDTEVADGALDRLVAAFESDPSLGIAGAQLSFPDGSPQWSGGRTPTLPWFFVLASGAGPLLRRLAPYRAARPLGAARARPVDWVTGAALGLRREVWQAAGPLDPRFLFYAQDLDLCVRAGRAGWRVEIRPEVRVLHHHGASISKAPGSFRRQNPALLWCDLLRWAGKEGGPARARSVRRVLAAGARLRLLALGAGRALRAPFVAASRRAEWREEHAGLRRAIAALPLAFPPPER